MAITLRRDEPACELDTVGSSTLPRTASLRLITTERDGYSTAHHDERDGYACDGDKDVRKCMMQLDD